MGPDLRREDYKEFAALHCDFFTNSGGRGPGATHYILPAQGRRGSSSGSADGRPAVTDDLGAVLARLWRVVDSRRNADPQTSYTARLFSRGRVKIAQKLGEEAVEAVIEGVRGDRTKLVGESADLIYHLLVLWADTGITPADVAAELRRREGASGLTEKRNRANL